MMSRSKARGAARGILLTAILALASLSCRSAEQRTTIRFWAMGREGEVVQELVRDFEQENPGIHVEVQQIPWSAAHEKMLTSHVGRASPDVAQLGNTWVAEFVALHALEPLAPWLARSTDVPRAGYFPGIWATNVVDSMPYGIPWYVDTRLVFYRTDILARAGYSHMPGTWEEWLAAMRAIRRAGGPHHYAIFLPLNEWTHPMILGLQAGSPLLKDGGTRGDFSGPEFRRAFGFFVSLFREGLAPPVSNTEIANLYQEFERGTFSMYITGPWNIGEFQRRLSPQMQGSWACAPLPGPTGEASGVSMAGGSSLVLFRSSPHKAAAWRLVEFLSRPAQQARFYRLCGDLPARQEAWRDSSIAGDRNLAAFQRQLERVAPWPMVPEWEEICIRLQDFAERAVRGGETTDAALAQYDRDVDRILEKRRWLAERHARAPRNPG